MPSPLDTALYSTQVGDPAFIHYGSISVPNYETNGGLSTLRQNILIYCPHCGAPWATIRWGLHEDYNRGPLHWAAEARLCLRHGGGNLLTAPQLYPEILEKLDQLFIEREFFIHLAQTEDLLCAEQAPC